MQVVGRLSRECVLLLAPDKLHFVINAELGEDLPTVWSEVAQAFVFEDYRIDSKHKNEILLRLCCEHLVTALRCVCVGDLCVRAPSLSLLC